MFGQLGGYAYFCFSNAKPLSNLAKFIPSCADSRDFRACSCAMASLQISLAPSLPSKDKSPDLFKSSVSLVAFVEGVSFCLFGIDLFLLLGIV